jgi:hypothetical protein
MARDTVTVRYFCDSNIRPAKVPAFRVKVTHSDFYAFWFRCPARITKMILKLRIFTIIWRYPTFRTINRWQRFVQT